jgi:aromatic ring-cleaving dioxygenase
MPTKPVAKKTVPKKTMSKKITMPKTTTDAPAATDPRAIAEYHAHVYYDPQKTRGRAEQLRARVAAEFPKAKLGRWHDELVGPHSQSMYQIAFPSRMLVSFLPWLMLNRDGLTILLHPETSNDYRDHTAHAAWLGAVLPLRLDVFSEQHPED